jgi:NTP pyrophosphatase (non-canonical NTP hydrolase)
MGNNMEINHYQRMAHLTAKYPAERALEYLVLGLASEAGEVAGKLKKVIRDDDGEMGSDKRCQLVNEVGDVLWYIAEIATTLNTSLSVVAQENLDKLSSRDARGVIGGSGDSR